eukprot:jgi/Hompol1/2424/HPOL_005995-RA
MALRADNRNLDRQVKLLTRKRDGLVEIVKGLKKEIVLEREARFIVEKCFNESVRKLELELEFRNCEILKLRDQLRALDLDVDYQCAMSASTVIAPITITVTASSTPSDAATSTPASQCSGLLSLQSSRCYRKPPSKTLDSPTRVTSEMTIEDIVFDSEGDSGSPCEDVVESSSDSVAVEDDENMSDASEAGSDDLGSVQEDDDDKSENDAASDDVPPDDLKTPTFHEAAVSRIFQELVSDIQPKSLLVDIEKLASEFDASSHQCLHAFIEASIRVCDVRSSWKSADKLLSFYRGYMNVFSVFIDDITDELAVLNMFEESCTRNPNYAPYHRKLLMTLYQMDFVDDEVFIAWYEGEVKPFTDTVDDCTSTAHADAASRATMDLIIGNEMSSSLISLVSNGTYAN